MRKEITFKEWYNKMRDCFITGKMNNVELGKHIAKCPIPIVIDEFEESSSLIDVSRITELFDRHDVNGPETDPTVWIGLKIN